MIEPRIVRRYASALLSAALKAGAVDQVESDLGLVSYTLEASSALTEAIYSPLIPGEKKEQILRDLFADKVHAITLSYLDLLVGKRREEAIVETEKEYVRLANEARGIVAAEVTSAVPLSDEEVARLKSKLALMTGKVIELSTKIDPAIIGGVTVKIGDRVIDGSIRGQLEALREKLLS